MDSGDQGPTWEPQGNAKIKFFRDNSAGNNRVGDQSNDGPAAPAGDTSDYDSNDDGFETDVTVGLNDAFARLDVSGGNATIEFASRRTPASIIAVANPFTPCFGRAWLNQTSTLSKDQFAINDQLPAVSFTSTSWAID